jgi:beta-lactamase regulating signal transducer with metallopeptidase domain
MENLLHVGLSNAVAAGVLALVAAAATFLLRRRPALVHALWLLVLLKLFTPPLVRLPAPWPSEEQAPEPVAVSSSIEHPGIEAEETPITLSRLPDDPAPFEAEAAPREWVEVQPEVVVAPPGDAERASEASATPAIPGDPINRVTANRTDWVLIAGTIWAAGSACWFVLAAIRVLRFLRLLRFAEVAPADLRERVARLAKRLGLTHYPHVLLMPGRLSPMLWAAGGVPRLLVPAGLLGQVRNDQLDTLLLHELAHLRRRDHWVRVLELLAMGLFWWNPVVWWARHELREAEEQCCDAWVVSVLSGSRRAYAEALVETLDFLSPAVPAQPLLSSGIGHVSDLKRRLTMILSGTTPRALTWRGVLAMFGLTCLLPLFPAWVRAQPPGADPKPVINKPQDEERVIRLRLEAADEKRAANVADEKVLAELKALEAQLAEKHAEIKMLEAMLQRLRARENVKKPADAAWQVVPVPGVGERVRIWTLPDGDTAKAKIFWKADAINRTAAPQHGTVYELIPGEKGSWILRPVDPKSAFRGAGQELRVEPPAVKIVPGRPGEVGSREKDLEKRLDAIMRELEQLRNEMKKPTGPKVPPTKPEEQGKLEQGGRSVIELRLIQAEEKAAKDLDAARRAVDSLKKAEDLRVRLQEVAAQQQRAEAEVAHARATLEKIREVAVESAPEIKEAEARLEAARARLEKIKYTMVQLKVQADEAARERTAPPGH